MKEQTLTVLAAGSLISTPVIIAAILVLAVIGIGFAIYVSRSSKKKAAEDAAGSGWQAQGQQDGWNQQAQQQQGWGGQGAPQQGWGGQGAPQQQQNPWGTSAVQQQNPWGNPAAAQNMSPAGGSMSPAGGANPWGSSPAQQANPWGAGAQQPQQPQQPDQAAAANPWGAQQPAQQAGQWNNQNQNQNAQNPWGASPAAAPVASQDPWAAQQQGSNQGWNNNAPAQSGSSPAQQPQGPNAFGGAATSGQGWSQQPSVPGQGQDPWAAQQQQAQYGAGAAPANANAPWQQSQPGYGQGYGAQGVDPNAGYGVDNDKTVLRNAPQQPYAGNVPGAHSIGFVRVEEGKEPGRVYEIRKESLSIGRSRESDIFLEDLAVSRLHASVVNMGNNTYALKDEGSANGTKVNGQMVNKFQTYPLQEGDRIQLGQTVLVFGRK